MREAGTNAGEYKYLEGNTKSVLLSYQRYFLSGLIYVLYV